MMTEIAKIDLNWARNVWCIAGGGHRVILLDDASIKLLLDPGGDMTLTVPVDWLLKVNDQGLTMVVISVALWEHVSWKTAALRVAKGDSGKGCLYYKRSALKLWRMLIEEVYGRRSGNGTRRFAPVCEKRETGKWQKVR